MKAVAAFPGQGCQKAGMGRDFHDASPEARAVFEEASQTLGLDMQALCFETDERLALTEYQQPAILTVEIAILRYLEASFDLQFERVGGHSLGEYAALVAAGLMPLGAALNLVRERGRLMQEAVPPGQGAMAAVLAKSGEQLDRPAIIELAARFDVDVANDNAPNQLVLSGKTESIDAALAAVSEDPALGKTRAIRLRVSAPFHSRWMKPVASAFQPILTDSADSWDLSKAPQVTSNTSGGLHQPSADAVISALTTQITATVRWTENMQALAEPGLPIFEIGPGRPLRGFFAAAGIGCRSISTIEQARSEMLECKT